MRLPSGFGHPVPLSTLGRFDYTGGHGNISRIDQKRVITLTGRDQGRQADVVLKDVKEIITTNLDDGTLEIPAGYSLEFAGEDKEQKEASAFLGKAFLFACGLIVCILVMQFNTLSAPLIIMSTVILSLIGVLVGLLVCGMPFGIIMTGIGVISLAGVVVNNAIVLLDYTRQLQHRGQDVLAAALDAGTTRLRPVLLTATTTIMGLIPMATGVSFNFHDMRIAWRSESSQWWASMATAVIFGLAFATLLTLVVVPTLYVSLYRLAARFGMGGLQRGEGTSQHTELEDY